MFNRQSFLGALSGAAIATMAATTALAQDVTLKLHHFLPPQANLPKNVIEPWAMAVEEASGGAIKIDRFYAMALGGAPPELIDQVLDGIADITVTVTGYTPGRYPRSEAFELPFMMTNAEATSKAYWEYVEANMLDTDFKDLKVLAVWVHGPGLIHSADPIAAPGDLNGVKLRAPTRITNKMFATLGATAVGMPVPAVPEALSKGTIDAAVIPWEVTGALKVPELVENHTEFGDASLYTTTFVLAMNKDKYDSLPDNLKAAIDGASGLERSGMAGGQMQADDAASREAAVDLGNNIITLSDDEVQTWRDAAAPVVDAWIAEMKDQGIDGEALVQQARDLIAKQTSM